MRVIILKDYQLISEWAAQYIHHKITNYSSKFVLGLPTGSTPIGVYKQLIKLGKVKNFEDLHERFNVEIVNKIIIE